MTFTEDRILHLRDVVKARMCEKRFSHTIGVEDMAIRLGNIFMPNRLSELRVAAIFHDVTKEMDIDEQLSFIDRCDKIDKSQKCVPQALHSFSGAAFISENFGECVSDDIFDAVMHHTLGDKNMNLFSEIIFLSDYIEEGREYPESIYVRMHLFDMIDNAKSYDEKLRALHVATVSSITYTLNSLEKRGLIPDQRSVMTKKAFETLI